MRTTPERALLRLTPAHFALYRASLYGLDEPVLHAHYDVPGTDVRYGPCRRSSMTPRITKLRARRCPTRLRVSSLRTDCILNDRAHGVAFPWHSIHPGSWATADTPKRVPET
ncbi:hypothetical protein C6Q35_27650 [Burkholderia multivorans]|nr:hypothetical protein C6Q35_27650 [Burkholderia multivorans]